MDYAKWHYDTHEQNERWNGRQIRNAFQIAYSLAHYETGRNSQGQWDEDAEPNIKKASNGPRATHTLNYRHFVLVAKAIEKFDDYLYDAIACTDMDHARDNGLRADDHDPNMYNRPGPSSAAENSASNLCPCASCLTAGIRSATAQST